MNPGSVSADLSKSLSRASSSGQNQSASFIWTPELEKRLKDHILKKTPASKVAGLLKAPIEAVLLRTAELERHKTRDREWWKEILTWNFGVIVDENQSVVSKKRKNIPKEVPLRFSSCEEYIRTFKPLVLEECKAQLKSSYEESTLQTMYYGILSVQSVTLCEDACHLVAFPLNGNEDSNSRRFSKNDLLWCTQNEPTKSSDDAAGIHVLGKVEEVTRNDYTRVYDLMVLFYLFGDSAHLNPARKRLKDGSKWHVTRILNMMPQVREFQALSSLAYIPGLPLILDPTSYSDLESQKRGWDSLPHPLQEKLQGSFNESQIQAIRATIGSSHQQTFSLIQGPPGTGKTRTIMAIVSCFLAAFDRAKILVCAQSNAAVDEVASRFYKGAFGSDGNPVKPRIVRLGQSTAISEHSQPFSVDKLVEEKLVGSRKNDRRAKQNVRETILKDAQVVFSTLNGCGGELLSCASKGALFDVVVMDEAAQALEPTSLIPLQLLKMSGGKCVMVGDPKQLPPTVISSFAQELYQTSMFERFQKVGYDVVMLTQQYRMHPEISRFPSLHFYDNKVLDAVSKVDKEADFHRNSSLGPYVVYDVTDGEEEQYGGKVCNRGEAEAIASLIRYCQRKFPSSEMKIGIITPYQHQVSVLQSVLGTEGDFEIKTVDSFQGREMDVIILNTVRSSVNGGVGFLSDVRRMNVALTRAQRCLWIVGNVKTLNRDPNWDTLVRDAQERGLVKSLRKPYKIGKKGAREKKKKKTLLCTLGNNNT